VTFQDLMAGPPPTLLPEDPADTELAESASPVDVVRRYPDSPSAWAALANQAAGEGALDVTVYAYARVGYHRSLDRLRRNGWKGHGPVPWSHAPNRGFLISMGLLAHAAKAIGEEAEYVRCRDFLQETDAEAYAVLFPEETPSAE
jgi:hypothetical protein